MKPNVQIPTGDPMKVRCLLADVPGWMHSVCFELIGDSDQPGRALAWVLMRRREDGYLVEFHFLPTVGPMADRPDSPRLRRLLEPILALPMLEIEPGKPLDRLTLAALHPHGQRDAIGTLIETPSPPVPRAERCTELFPEKP